MTYPTGEQYALSLSTPAGELRAVITERAAGIRELSVGAVDLVQSFDAEIEPPHGAGVVLLPWANRIPDGEWVDASGMRHRLAISEVERNNAIHGLLLHTFYNLVEASPSAVTLAARVLPCEGYPYELDTSVKYELVEDGLTVTHSVRNVDQADAPVVIGAHPYLAIGDVPSEELLLTVNADTHICVDERLIPVGLSPVDGTRFDLRETSIAARRVGDLQLDDAWADARFTGDETVHSLTAPDGRSVSLWADHNFPFVQVFITPHFPVRGAAHETHNALAKGADAEGVVTAVAIEPMTGPANAFNSGHGLKYLAPGEEWVCQWGIRFAAF